MRGSETARIASIVAVLAGCSGGSSAPVREVERLASGNSDLAALAKPGSALVRAGAALVTAPGARVRARLPARADGTIEVGVGASARFALRLSAQAASGATARLEGGRAVYAGAWPGVDVLWAAAPARVNLFLLIHQGAPAELAWHLERPAGLPAARPDGAGGLVFAGPGQGQGEPELHLVAPFAIDARGVRPAAQLIWQPEAERLLVRLDARGLRFPVLVVPGFTASWELKASGGPAPLDPRMGVGMTYDPNLGLTLMFGGDNGNPTNRLAQTWQWNGAAWALRTTTTTPPGRSLSPLSYDAVHRAGVMFGGDGGAVCSLACIPVYLGDTWLWDSATSNWQAPSLSLQPPIRRAHAMAWDPSRAPSGMTLLHGGRNGQGLQDDTWEWNGSGWADRTSRAAPHPGPREQSAMAFDAVGQVIVLYGGSGAGGPLGDTWTWNGTSWTQIMLQPGQSPPPLFGHQMVSDSRRRRIVLLGGIDATGAPRSETWEWNGAIWEQTASGSPSARQAEGLAFDSARGRTVSFGGIAGGTRLVDTWEYFVIGTPCMSDTECDTLHCTDGVCCTVASCGACRTCNGATPGMCSPQPDGTSCDDATVCNGRELCQGGTCQSGTPLTCMDANPCTQDLCDPMLGCQFVPQPDGTACPGGRCAAGTCCLGCVGPGADGGLLCLPGNQLGQCGMGGAPCVSCDDANLCTSDACTGGACVHSNNNLPCDDGNRCTTGDMCAGGLCVGGPALNCNDSNPCTDDSCSPASGCVHTNNTQPCDDGSMCTTGDRCAAGACVGGPPLNCDDGNPCTTDTCDPALGCRHMPVANGTSCSDGNPCNGVETCQLGVCSAGTPVNCDDSNACTSDSCNMATGLCSHTPVPNGTGCPDGNACNGNETCQMGVCSAGTPINCNDANPCTTDTCNPMTGGCSHGPVANGTSCADADLCNGAETCQMGVCTAGTPVNCNDNNPCTADACNPPTGTCTHSAVADGTPCADANLCNGAETCQAGTCTAGTPINCNDNNACTTDTCIAATGMCMHANVANGTACSDGNPCTNLDACQNGSCVGQPIAGCVQCMTAADCNDNNACTTDACTASTCTHTPVANGVSCADGNLCNGAETCQAGVCQPGAPPSCNDANPCTTDTCNPTTGCAHTSVANGTSCPDGDACNGNETCQAGACQPGTPPSCDDANPCTTDACNAATGCTHSAQNGTPCNDGNACTTGDMCVAGICTGTPTPSCRVCTQSADCNDGNPCTEEACNRMAGTCQSQMLSGCCTSNAECADTNPCTADSCTGSPPRCVHATIDDCCATDADCNDGDPCSADLCMDKHCFHDRIGGCCTRDVECTDGSACTRDQCDTSTNLCTHAGFPGCCSASADCNDGFFCTQDSCNTATGVCTDTPMPGCCNSDAECGDGDPCTDDICDQVAHQCAHLPNSRCTADGGTDAGSRDGGTDGPRRDGAIVDARPTEGGTGGNPDAGVGAQEGGCGCRVGAGEPRVDGVPLTLLVLVLVLLARRRRG